MPASQHDIPITTMIRRDIVQALSQVRIVAGRHCDLKPEEARAEGNTKADGVVIVDRIGFDVPGEEALGHSERAEIFQLYCYAGQSQNSADPIADKIERMEADITKALCAEESASNRSAYAMSTEIADGAIYFEPECGLYCLALTVRVHSRSGFFDPYFY